MGPARRPPGGPPRPPGRRAAVRAATAPAPIARRRGRPPAGQRARIAEHTAAWQGYYANQEAWRRCCAQGRPQPAAPQPGYPAAPPRRRIPASSRGFHRSRSRRCRPERHAAEEPRHRRFQTRGRGRGGSYARAAGAPPASSSAGGSPAPAARLGGGKAAAAAARRLAPRAQVVVGGARGVQTRPGSKGRATNS